MKMCEDATADIISNRLLQHLTASSEIKKVSNKFSALNKDAERVSYVYQLLKVQRLIPKYENSNKNDKRSKGFREDGNLLFKRKKDQNAIEMYTKSVMYAEEKETLALAYANRSAVLFENGFYEECLVDINLAKVNYYPPNLLEKLAVRQNKSEIQIQQQIRRKYHKNLPKITSESNANIQCAGDSVQIKNTQNYGRHVIAKRDIEIGEVIAIERPFTSILLREHSLNHCSGCLKFSFNLIPCKKCVHVAYCSETCLNTAWEKFHKHECSILDVLYRLNATKFMLIALKIALLASKNTEQKQTNQSIYKSENYEEIHDLITNETLRNLTDLFDRSVAAALLFHYVKNHTDFFDNIEEENVFCGLVLKHLQTGPSNFHEISELQNSESVEIGSGAYSFLSLLNHSCNPNIVRHCYGTSIVLRALSPINKGEQLLDNYGYHYAINSRNERREALKKQYHFQCECVACMENWPLYDSLDEKDNSFKIDDETLKKLQEIDEETAENILPELLKKAKELEALKPCRSLSAVQECIKKCYVIFANKSYFL